MRTRRVSPLPDRALPLRVLCDRSETEDDLLGHLVLEELRKLRETPAALGVVVRDDLLWIAELRLRFVGVQLDASRLKPLRRRAFVMSRANEPAARVPSAAVVAPPRIEIWARAPSVPMFLSREPSYMNALAVSLPM